jgi:hypothetical protein
LHERLAQLSITETSRDGMVKVTVSTDGLMTDLVLKDRWHPPSLPELAEQIMDCLSRAQARIPDLVRQAMTESVGAPDAGAHLVLNDARNRFPEPAPPPPDERTRHPADELRIGQDVNEPPPARPERPPTEHRTEDDWDERAFLEDM